MKNISCKKIELILKHTIYVINETVNESVNNKKTITIKGDIKKIAKYSQKEMGHVRKKLNFD